MNRDSYFIGVDLGQVRDYTALAVISRCERQGAWDAGNLIHKTVVSQRVRHLERIRLGTPYPEVVARVTEVVESLAGAWGARCELVVDGNGVGRPVVDLLRRQVQRCGVRAVVATAGSGESESDGYYRVPKRDLIAGLQVMLQTGELKIVRSLEYAGALEQEMARMRVKVTGGGEVFGGPKDDLVFAVALAAWGARKFVLRDLYGDRRLV